MPKIEVLTETFYQSIGQTYTDEQLEEILPSAKAELDGKDEDAGILKIELNDTNRPDLWSSAGLVRQIRTYTGNKPPFYDFFSNEDEEFEYGNRIVEVDPKLKDIRPFITAFAVTGKKIDDT
ncbi:MAG: phenylalanine--tRNA ligase subunit beta, partial [Spirochaetia bacterium]|nr:phenylalanine--tRNA ligase subunit beta [Spirochaetia bacterium]